MGQGEPHGPCQPSWPRGLRAGGGVCFQVLPPLTVIACGVGQAVNWTDEHANPVNLNGAQQRQFEKTRKTQL